MRMTDEIEDEELPFGAINVIEGDVVLVYYASSTLMANGWCTIERAQHDGRRWIESTGQNSLAWRYSGRISDACVEGPTYEMLALAQALRDGRSFDARRCACCFVHDGVLLWSPRNSQVQAKITREAAAKLSAQIFELLGSKAVAP